MAQAAGAAAMLKSVDILIGFTVIMLVVSIAVTIVNQMITSMLNLRGVHLRDGVCRLLRYIDHGIDKPTAGVLANMILRDPIVATPRLIGVGGFRFAHVIQREELTVLLLRIAASEATELEMGPLPETDGTPARRVRGQPKPPPPSEKEVQLERIQRKIEQLTKARDLERKAPQTWITRPWNWVRGEATNTEKKIAALGLRRSICDNGLLHLHETLADIRNKVVELEISSPTLSSSVRSNQAILACAKSDFVAKLNAWFDQTIDRVEEAYTSSSLIWTMLAALAIAGALQLDALGILNRLGVDDTYRVALLNQISSNPDLVDTIASNQEAVQYYVNPAEPGAKPVSDKAEEARKKAAKEQKIQDAIGSTLSLNDIIEIPNYATYKGVGDYITRVKAIWPGMLLSTALLSLGGPFWYEMLKNLLKLRSVLATKDDANRQERQSSQSSPVEAA
jgi:hypothetical protein